MMGQKEAVAVSALETPIEIVHLAATPAGLLKVTLGDGAGEAFTQWPELAHWSTAPSLLTGEILRQAEMQLLEYLSGARRQFDLPFDLRGTAFQRMVWEAVAAIPYGETMTYGAIAARLGKPSAARAVGAANGANPLPIFVPCHRVLGADGSLTGYGGGLPIKRALLELEQTGRLSS